MTENYIHRLSGIGIIFLMFLHGCTDQNTTSNPSHPGPPPPNIVFFIADDWSYPHAGVYGDEIVRTPTFDFLAKEGALFNNAFCASPSCSPSRASILTSRYPHQLESAGNLWSVFPKKFSNWVSILESNGYHTGKSRKGWGPGDYESGGYTHNPAGRDYPNFRTFLDSKDQGQPFFYWFGSKDPHRDYETNTGIKTGMDPASVEVPAFLPDTPCIRNDLLDYYFEVERFDRECGNIIRILRTRGLLENTILVMTSDNGMPFPRAKANLYDYGTRMPLVIYWTSRIEPNSTINDFVNFVDLGPTFLEAAGISVPDEFEGKSLIKLLNNNQINNHNERNRVFLERERHANVRKGNLSYPSRAIRTSKYLYIRNFEHERWPAGDSMVHQSVGQYGDVDNSISKFLILANKDDPEGQRLYKLAFDKRPPEELYILANDPYNINNVATSKKYECLKDSLHTELTNWMNATGDLRATQPKTTYWDEVLYTPNYQRQNFDLDEEINNYSMLLNNGSAFKKSGCYKPNTE